MPKGAFTREKAAAFWAATRGFYDESERGAFRNNPALGARMSKEMAANAKVMCEFAKDVAALESGL